VRDNDGRKLDHKTLEALRIRAVDQVGEGAHPEHVAAALGLHRKTVCGWLGARAPARGSAWSLASLRPAAAAGTGSVLPGSPPARQMPPGAARLPRRSRRPGPEQHIQALGPAARRRGPLGPQPDRPARRGGPGSGGSRPPCGASGRTAWWSAAHGPGPAARRSAAAPDPRPSGRPKYDAASAASRPCPPPRRPARTCGAPRVRPAGGTAAAASAQRLPAAAGQLPVHLQLIQPQPHERIGRGRELLRLPGSLTMPSIDVARCRPSNRCGA
jgi:hypothetical protein